MSQTAAGFVNRGWIDRGIPDIHELDLPIGTDHERGPVAHAVRTQDAIGLRYFAIVEIAEQREIQFQLFGENSLGGDVIGGNAKYYCVVRLEFSDTSLVRGKFLGSATCERGGEKSHHHRVLSFVVGERNFATLSRGQSKVGRNISHLQRYRISRLLSAQTDTQGGCEQYACGKSH
jgi:hypothetical protein